MDFIEPVHRMQLPREVLIGHGVLKRIDDLCRELGFRNSILILTGPHVYDLITHHILQCLERVGYTLTVYIVHESKFRYVKETMDLIEKSTPEALLGIGGGKVIDVGKLAASNYGLPFISIPTAASHDGISSPRANIKDFDKPISVETHAPLAILADLEIISQSRTEVNLEIRSPHPLAVKRYSELIIISVSATIAIGDSAITEYGLFKPLTAATGLAIPS